MCGIVGVVGRQPVVHLLMDALRRLEYRGYDSAGIATLLPDGGGIGRRRAEGKLINLANKLDKEPLTGMTGIGHTRWATHGRVNEQNAHPHATDRVAVVHNGIIENFASLKTRLMAEGCCFESETDTEIIAHLVTHALARGLSPQAAIFETLRQLTGAFALAFIFRDYEGLMIGARRGTPLAIGWGEANMFLGSDAMALAPFTNRVTYLEDGDWAVLSPDGAVILNQDGQEVQRPITHNRISGAMVGKDGYRHFMLKEIYEQPQVVGDTLNAFAPAGSGDFALPPFPFELGTIPRITIIACGTACLAGAVARLWIEQLAGIPAEVELASEFRFREPVFPPGGVALFISQSGETLDTLEALRHARRMGQRIVSVVNVPESTIARESDVVLPTLAGPEIGVASTKAFTTQLTVLACFAAYLGRATGRLAAPAERDLAQALREVPARLAEILAHDPAIEAIAHEIAASRDVLYLGRGTSCPIALEGALKLKEISYIHAEGFAAGEMKHGPIALIDEQVPIVVIAPPDTLFEKTASNLQEAAARGGRVFLLSDASGVARLQGTTRWALTMPACHPITAPILYVLPLQLLAYHVAVIKGTDVDQPRNLAKSVTVE